VEASGCGARRRTGLQGGGGAGVECVAATAGSGGEARRQGVTCGWTMGPGV
jgi:hypothetical protein